MLQRGMGAATMGERPRVTQRLPIARFQGLFQRGHELDRPGCGLTFRGMPVDLAQVVGDASAADDQHARLAQRGQGLAQRQMPGAPFTHAQGQLKHRQRRRGPDAFEWQPHPMVERPLLGKDRDALGNQRFTQPPPQRSVALGRPTLGIQGRGKAIEVVLNGRMRHGTSQPRRGRVPMGRDAQDRARLRRNERGQARPKRRGAVGLGQKRGRPVGQEPDCLHHAALAEASNCSKYADGSHPKTVAPSHKTIAASLPYPSGPP